MYFAIIELAWEGLGVGGIGGGGVGRGWGDGWLGLAVPGKKCDFWKVLGLARNPSKKMRLDESCRMVQSACHFVAYIKSYGQKLKSSRASEFGLFSELQRLAP